MANYYVDFNTGDDTDTGLSGHPWKYCPGTVGESGSGWEQIAAGDTIHFAHGQTWDKAILINSSNFDSGSSGNEITLTSDSTDLAIIDLAGSSSYADIIKIYNRDYINIEYFECERNAYESDARGIYLYYADHCKIRYNYVHNIYGNAHSYGISADRSNYGEIAYNDIRNVREKLIELWGNSSDCHDWIVHHNFCRNEGSFSYGHDHGMVDSGQSNTWYCNILVNDDSATGRVTPIYGFKTDGNLASSSSHARNCKFYNNIIIGYPCGMGAIESYNSSFIGNTVYQKNHQGVGSGSYDNHGILIYTATYCTYRNNIIYYPRAVGEQSVTAARMFFDRFGPGSNSNHNTITDNIFYRTGSDERYRVGGTSTYTLAQMEGAGVWNGEDNNVMENNIEANPGFLGGSHTVSDLPTGFDESWLPDDNGLEIDGDSAGFDVGYAVGSPYDEDIEGTPRPQGEGWDIGAYEFAEGGTTTTAAPTTTTTPAPTTTTTTTAAPPSPGPFCMFLN